MNLFRRLFGGGGGGDPGDDELPTMPWDRQPSILEFVRSQTVEGQPGSPEAGNSLPDDDRIRQGSNLRWAAGAWDGVTTHHMGTGQDDEAIRRTVELVVAYSRQPTAANKAAVYQHVIGAQVVSIIDPVVEALVKTEEIRPDRMYELARSFVTEAPDREPVKFGIALLGLFRQPEDHDLFQTLGRHDEFTLFSAVALANSSDDPDEALWTLARNVTGWGRIHAVERLAHTEIPAIKQWLLREGFRNSVMYEYLAATCARTGGLLAALSDDDVDREVLTAAGEILQALIADGPAEGIDDYEDARPVIETYLGHMESDAETIPDFLHVHSVRDFLAEDDARWASRFDAGWTAQGRDRLRSICDRILNRPEWSDRVRAALGTESEPEFSNADQAAKALGIDTWVIHWRRLQAKPTEPGRWYHVLTRCDESRIERVLELAETAIDLPRIATGAGNELGLGPGFEPHSCLDYVLQELRRFPGRGMRLIEAGFQSPVVRNRNMAVVALATWPRSEWPDELEGSLERAAEREPRNDVQERMRQALHGESLS